MASIYKVLGQAASSAAATNAVDNLITDASFESSYTSTGGYTQISSSIYGIRVGTGVNTDPRTAIGSPWVCQTSSSTSNDYPYFNIVNGPTTNRKGSYGLGWYTNTNAVAYLCLGSDGRNSVTSNTFAADRVAVSANTLYYFAFNVASNTTSSPSTLSVYVYYYDSSNNYLSNNTLYQSTPSGNSNSWQRIQNTFTTPANTAYVGFVFQYSYSTSNGFQWYVDAISLSTNSSLYTTYNDQQTDSTTYPGNRTFFSPYTNRILGWEGATNFSRTIRTYAGALRTLYSVPTNTQAISSSIVVSNPNTSATTYRIAILPAGTAPTDSSLSITNFIAFDHAIAANASTTMTIGITLNAGDAIYVSSDIANVGFTLFGSEVTP